MLIVALTWCILAALTVALSTKAHAAALCPEGIICEGGCTPWVECSGGRTCESKGRTVRDPLTHELTTVPAFVPTGPACGGGVGQAVLGGVKIPWGVKQYAPTGQNTSESIGIVNFASKLLRLFTIVSGIYFMVNMFYAGYLFLSSSGDAAVFGKFKESLYYSLVGLFIIATGYLIAGVVGAIFFGDPGFIIRPTLFQATAP